MAFSRIRSDTRSLTQGSMVLSVKRPSRRGFMVVCSVLLLALITMGAVLFMDGWRQWSWWPQWLQAGVHSMVDNREQKSAQQWQQERDDLQKEINRMRLGQEIETAIRHELEQKIVDLQKQLKTVELQLDFVKSNQPLLNR